MPVFRRFDTMQLYAVIQAIQDIPLAAATGMAQKEEQIADHDSPSWRVVTGKGGRNCRLVEALLQVLQELESLNRRGGVRIEIAQRGAQLIIRGSRIRGGIEETHLVALDRIESFGDEIPPQFE